MGSEDSGVGWPLVVVGVAEKMLTNDVRISHDLYLIAFIIRKTHRS